jgi:hypothetical protein
VLLFDWLPKQVPRTQENTEINGFRLENGRRGNEQGELAGEMIEEEDSLPASLGIRSERSSLEVRAGLGRLRLY